MDLYFDCNFGISGDMAVASLLDLGADRKKLDEALSSLNLENEFSYEITDKLINSIHATDFNVILPKHPEEHHDEHHNEHDHKNHPGHHHIHRNLDDIVSIINKAACSNEAKVLAKKIFNIVALAESKVHRKDIKDIHFHEIGAIDSIVDILSFSVLFCELNPNNVYFSTLSEGSGEIMCQHGLLSVPVPAVCEIVSEYKIPIKITSNIGEMITPTGAAIVAALYKQNNKLPDSFTINKIGYGAGKRNYKNPILRVMQIEVNKE